jgi:hypothetical protein
MSVWHYVVCWDCREYVNIEKTDWYQIPPSEFQVGVPVDDNEARHAQRVLYFVRLHSWCQLVICNEFEFDGYCESRGLWRRDDFKEVLSE